MSANFLVPVIEIDVHQLSSVVRSNIENILIIDSRSFSEHNACHIISAVNISYSKVVKRRLQQDKLSVKELLIHTCNRDVDEKMDVIVYDQSSEDCNSLPADSFIVILIKKLQLSFRSISLLSGGFEEFRRHYPDLCEERIRKCPPFTSLSQPCLPLTNQGPTRILSFLYLGTQMDAMNQDVLKDCNITYELNVSTTCPQPDFLAEGHFMRIPVNDTYSEKLLPYFPQAFNFLDKVREGSSSVLVHCLAGISRSPTIVIGYVMRYLHLSSDDGYRYVKSKRPTISPNFNFLGQLLEYEKELRVESILEPKPEARSDFSICSQKRLCKRDPQKLSLSLDIDRKVNEPDKFLQPRKEDHSPTSALAKLSFDVPNTEENKPSLSNMRIVRSKSTYAEWLRPNAGVANEKKTNEIPALSKILSPVKEIKCDGLISEISAGYSEISMKCKELIRQRIGRFSTSSFKSHDSQKSSENFPRNKKSKSMDFRKYKWHLEDKKGNESSSFFHKSNAKLTSYIPHVRSSENLAQTGGSVLKFGASQEQYSFDNTNRNVQYSLSLNSDLHKLTDSSLCVNKNSDLRTFNLNQMADDMYFEEDFFNNKNLESNPSASENENFPVTFFGNKNRTLSTTNSSYPMLDKSDSTSMKIRRNKTELSPPTGSRYALQDSKNFHEECGIPSSSWSRKRGADFDAHQFKGTKNFPIRDKRKYEPFKKSISSDFIEDCLNHKDENSTDVSVFLTTNQDNFLNDCSSRLYRVQSCPLILWRDSSFYKRDIINEFPLKKNFGNDPFHATTFISRADKELPCHESCPDVLNLGVVDSFLAVISHRPKEFRRNIRMVKVS